MPTEAPEARVRARAPRSATTILSTDASVVVVGGGISGLVAAWTLARRGVRTVLLEAAGRVGGVMASQEREGRLVELGPHSAQLTEPLATLVAELSLETSVVRVSPLARCRYIASRGRLLPVPMSPRSLATTPLLSARAKLRLLREPFVRRATDSNETLSEFIERRLGREPLAAFVAPFARGVYGGDPAALSARLAMPKLFEMERRYGSLVRGAIAGGRAKRHDQHAPARGPHSSVSFRLGMAELPNAIATRLGERVVRNALVRAIKTTANGCLIDVEHRDGTRRRIYAQHVIVATPAHELPAIHGSQVDSRALTSIAGTEYAPIATVTLGARRADVGHTLDGFGFLVADGEERSMLGALFTSTMFPGRCPDDEVLLTCFVGGVASLDLAALPTPSLVARLHRDLSTLIGLRGDVRVVAHTRLSHGIPQYTVAHAQILDAADRIERACPALSFAGSWRTGVSVGDCIRGGRAAAERALLTVSAQ